MKLHKLLTVAIVCFFTMNADAQTKKKTVAKSKTTAAKKTAGKPKQAATPKQLAKPKIVAPIRIKIQTDSGIMVVRLYDSTPLHRDNFLKLVTSGFYDSLMFHRVIPEFMIQGGDPLSKNAPPMTPLGSGGADMQRIPAEFRPSLRHKRGVIAAARDNNPEKASSACQFYIVQGKVMNDAELDMIENRKGIKYTAAEREIYKTIGGTPFLDMEYTVFGEVESGYEVIDKIASVPRDAGNRPTGDVRMYMQVLK